MPARKPSKAKTRAAAPKRKPRRSRIANLRTDHALDMETRVLIQEAKADRRPKAKARRSKSSTGSVIKAGKRILRKAAKEIGQLFDEPKTGKRRGRISRKEAQRQAMMIAGSI